MALTSLLDMSHLHILLVLLHRIQWDAVAGLRNFVYQKDMSEYCRRRAMPSVFLSRQVMETNAQMLHFSKLDLPYTCFTSIRTESSSNIIMVIQLSSGLELESSCQQCGNQLLVYEFGETFGGYWGPMPEGVMKPSPLQPKWTQPYTLKTTKPPTTTEIDDSSEDEKFSLATKKVTTATTTRRPGEDDYNDFIRIEVPLVNFSGNLVPAGGAKVDKSFLEDEAFDLMYDVTPRRGVQYETSILPLVQISVRQETDQYGRRNDNEEARYELDFDFGTFTPDYRLTMPFLSTRSRVGNRNRNLWKGKKFEKKRFRPKASSAPLFTRLTGTFGKPYKSTRASTLSRVTSYKQVLSKKKTNSYDETTMQIDNTESFDMIEDIMKFLNRGRDLEKQEPRLKQGYLPVIKNISDMHHNFSAYLLPWSTYTYIPVREIFGNFTRSIYTSPLRETTKKISTTSSQTRKANSAIIMSERTHTSNSHRNILEKLKGKVDIILNEDKNKTARNQTITSSVSSINTSKYNTLSQITKESKGVEVTESVTRTTKDVVTFPSTEIVKRNFTGSLVDHESWENVVQSAPVMAVLLNQHAPHETPHLPLSNETHANFNTSKSSNHAGRSRRSIEPIPIGLARPHTRRTIRPRVTVRTQPPQVADMQHFAQLLELPDDEMSPHAALRFIRQYAGPLVYNICDQFESANKMRHVVLFNSSRIILAIDNFTISRMTVVMTTAHALLSSESRCSDDGIECQISGARVCIDSTSACDGIPNCGAHDIYDEDRLQCGGSLGLQHSVSLAAITFMAVLLTTLCIVHYWLNRCVPKVADAFFVYTDTAENVLYLDTIMRSPTDVDTPSKYLYDGYLFEENINEYSYNEKKPSSIWRRLISKLSCFKHKHKSCELTEVGDLQKIPEKRKVYSFTELEILNMKGTFKIDEAVQTGESLEMAFLKMINSLKQGKPDQVRVPSVPPRRKLSSGFPLVLLQNTKDRASHSAESSSSTPGHSMQEGLNFVEGLETVENEREILSTLYESQGPGIILGETSKGTGTIYPSHAKKRLRFEEQAMFIPIPEDEEEPLPPEPHAPLTDRHSIVLGTETTRKKRRNKNSLEAISQDTEPPSSDFRRFFKGKGFRKKKEYK